MRLKNELFWHILVPITIMLIVIGSKINNIETKLDSMGAAHTSPLILSPPKAAPTLLDAIIQVESGGDPEAKGDYKDGVPRAVGILQIWPIMVKDCNRILGSGKYTLDDRLSPDKSIEMFNVWRNHYCKGWTDKQIATGWHLGCNNKDKPDEVYWSKIQKVLGDTK